MSLNASPAMRGSAARSHSRRAAGRALAVAPGRRAWISRFPAGAWLLFAGGLANCGGDETGPVPPRTPAAITVFGGDSQLAMQGGAVKDPVLVRVTAADGKGVTAVPVRFEVTIGGGAVEFSETVTTPHGVASPGNWTLGEPGEQQLTATVQGVGSVSFAAEATGRPAAIVFVDGAGQRAEVGTAVPRPPSAMVTDKAGEPLRGIRVVFRAGAGDGGGTVAGAEQWTGAAGRASPDGWTLGTVAGTYRLLAVVPNSDIEGAPAVAEAVAVPGPAAVISAEEGDGQETEAGQPAPVVPRAKVADAYGNGIAGVAVIFEAVAGGGSVAGAETTTDLAGMASPEQWTMGAAAGTNTLSATVQEGPLRGRSASFAAMASPPDFDIEIHHVRGSLVTPAHRRTFDAAVSAWQSAIGNDLRPAMMSKEELNQCGGRHFDVHAESDRVIDDLLIYTQIVEIDGPGAILGLAGPCFIRAENGLPIAGIMAFDIADADALEEGGAFAGTVLHEMAHVLGFGSLWQYLGLLADPASAGNDDPHFVGAAALAAFDSIGGASYTGGAKVPVENLGGDGTRDGHWRESVFGTELMTGWINGGDDPLSAVSIVSLEDLGYEGVDISGADDFRLSRSGEHPGGGRRFYLGADILRIPVGVVDRRGRVIRTLPPGR